MIGVFQKSMLEWSLAVMSLLVSHLKRPVDVLKIKEKQIMSRIFHYVS